jgi:hypothetical protein
VRQRRAEQVVGLELTDRFPERGEQVGGQGPARFFKRASIRLLEQLEFVSTERGVAFLFGQADPRGLLPGCGIGASAASVGAHQHASAELRPALGADNSKVPAATNSKSSKWAWMWRTRMVANPYPPPRALASPGWRNLK